MWAMSTKTKTLLSRVFLRLPYGYYLLKQIKLALFLGEMDDSKEIHTINLLFSFERWMIDCKEIHVISLSFWWFFSFERWMIDCKEVHIISLLFSWLFSFKRWGDRLHCNTSHKFSHTYIMSWMHQIWLIDTHTIWIIVIKPKIEFLAAHEVSGMVTLCIVKNIL